MCYIERTHLGVGGRHELVPCGPLSWCVCVCVCVCAFFGVCSAAFFGGVNVSVRGCVCVRAWSPHVFVRVCVCASVCMCVRV